MGMDTEKDNWKHCFGDGHEYGHGVVDGYADEYEDGYGFKDGYRDENGDGHG